MGFDKVTLAVSFIFGMAIGFMLYEFWLSDLLIKLLCKTWT